VVREDKAPHLERIVGLDRIKVTTPDLNLLNCHEQIFAQAGSIDEANAMLCDLVLACPD
jgi:hypothetical protein